MAAKRAGMGRGLAAILPEADQSAAGELRELPVALVTADRVIVPVQAEYLALEGLVQFLDTLAMIRREMNPALDVSGLLITMHDERTRLAQDVERELREHFPELVFRTVIPRSVRVAEAPSYGLPVTEHAPSSRASTAYRALTEELTARGR